MTQITLKGRFFRTGSAASKDALLRKDIASGVVTLVLDQEQIEVEIDEVSDHLVGVARKIRLRDVGVFEASSNVAVDEFMGSGKSFFSRLSRVESNLPLALFAAVVVIGLLFSLYRYGLPALANGLSYVTPKTIVQLMDRSTLETMDRVVLGESKLSEDRKQDISAQFDEILKIAGKQDEGYQLLFRDGGRIGPNAFALPGGTVIMTDQLVKLSKHDDEIAGVLGHEIAHVEQRHSLRQIYRILGLGFIISVIGGDSGQMIEDVATHAATISNLSYSRSFEVDADLRGAALMVKLNRDPFAFIDLLKRLGNDQQKEGETSWLSTHPSSFDRRAHVKSFLRDLKDE